MKKILEVIEQLNDLKICTCCYGNIKNGVCTFCGHQFNEANELTKKLKKLLNGKPINFKIFIELLDIKDIDPFINKLIDENKDYFKEYLKENYTNQKFDEIIELLNKENANYIINPNHVFKNLAKIFYIKGTSNLSDEAYMNFLKLYTDKILENSNIKDINNRRPYISFVDDEEIEKISSNHSKQTRGICYQTSAGFYSVKLNQNLFLKNKNESLITNMKTIYHELQHIIQEIYYKNPKRYNLVGLLMAKDFILNEKIENYYHDNYEVLPIEANANYSALLSIIGDLKSLNIYNGELEEYLNNYKKLNFNQIRICEGQQVNVNNLFSEFQIESDVLTKYPILSLEYKEIGSILVKRSKEEIEEMLKIETNKNIITILNYVLDTFKQEKRI